MANHKLDFGGFGGSNFTGVSNDKFGDAYLDTDYLDKSAAKKAAAVTPYVSCYRSHKALDLGHGRVVYGGSCSTPLITDADVYVGLDLSMAKSLKSFPWNAGESILFSINDAKAPSNKPEFVKMIDWLACQINSGLKVHVGCIGGHGRTGMVLSALACVMHDQKDAIEYVRKCYCHKVVESQEQVKFLVDTFGIAPAAASKVFTKTSNTKNSGFSSKSGISSSTSFTALKSTHCMWGPKAIKGK